MTAAVREKKGDTAVRIFTGIKASDGMAIGTVASIDRGAVGLHRIVSDPFRERALYEAAIVLAKDELQRLQQHAQGSDADILLFQTALLEDDSFTNEIGDYIAAGAGSAAAVERAEQIFAERLNNVDNAYIRERSVDVRDACRRVVDILDGRPRRRLHLTHPAILAADLFFPSDLFSLDRKMILGIASDNDSPTSHAAIVARNLGIPAVFRLGDGMAALTSGHRAVLDAETATLIMDPNAQQLAEANRKIVALAQSWPTPDPLVGAPNTTKDGTPFTLLVSANISTTAGIAASLQAGAVGIGLVRTESMLSNELDEQQQYEQYCSCLHAANGTPVVFRVANSTTEAATRHPEERAPSAGQRVLWRTQMIALLRASMVGDTRILLPSIGGVGDWDDCMQAVERCKAILRERGTLFGREPQFGCLIEYPAAALMAGEIMDHGAKFLYVDVDALACYTCGIPRESEQAGRHAGDPAVLRLLEGVLSAAAQRGVPVEIGGFGESELGVAAQYLHLGARIFCTEKAFLIPLKAKLREVELGTP